MTKKRRTRAQKQRAAARRELAKTVAKISTSNSLEIKDKAIKPIEQLADLMHQEKPKTSSIKNSDLARSLILVFVLVAIQIGLWLIFTLTKLDDKLYKLIKI